MFEAAQCFPLGSVPKLSPGAQDYEVVQKKATGLKIVRYVDPTSRVPDERFHYGYVTAFTYFHCKEQGLLTEADVRAYVKLQPRCGVLSYSEIPRRYCLCLGMTGTLRCEFIHTTEHFVYVCVVSIHKNECIFGLYMA